MANTWDTVIAGGTVVTPGGTAVADVAIKDGRFADVGSLDKSKAGEVVDATGLHVLPGVIDTQVHFREPGATHKEDIGHGTKAAVLGGVTAIFEMPNTSPLTLDEETLAWKLNRAAETGWCDHAFFIGGSAESVGRLAELEILPGCAGVKIFMGSSTGSLLAKEDDLLARIMADGRRRVAIHAEDEDLLLERQHIATEGGDPTVHPVWRNEEAALKATQRITALAEEAGRPVHVLHITTAEEMAFLAEHKELVSVEVTPNHLTMVAPDCYERLGAFAQMNPPVREERHRAALWEAVNRGVVDILGSDHAPHTIEEKERPYPSSPSGMPGVQTLVPLLLDHVANGRLTLQRFVELTSAGPQRLFGIAGKGRIAVGYDADLTLVDLGAKRTITDEWIASICGWTPHDGTTVTGWPKATVIRGQMVMRDDEVLGTPSGRPVRFVAR